MAQVRVCQLYIRVSSLVNVMMMTMIEYAYANHNANISYHHRIPTVTCHMKVTEEVNAILTQIRHMMMMKIVDIAKICQVTN